MTKNEIIQRARSRRAQRGGTSVIVAVLAVLGGVILATVKMGAWGAAANWVAAEAGFKVRPTSQVRTATVDLVGAAGAGVKAGVNELRDAKQQYAKPSAVVVE